MKKVLACVGGILVVTVAVVCGLLLWANVENKTVPELFGKVEAEDDTDNTENNDQNVDVEVDENGTATITLNI